MPYLVLAISLSSAVLIMGLFLHSAVAASVPLLNIKTDNSTLKHELPKFYHCISSAVWHSKDKQSDPYFKTEPTKNEVLKCFNKVLAKEDAKKESGKSR